MALLLPAWGGIRIRGSNGTTYVHSTQAGDRWEIPDYTPDPDVAERMSSTCAQDDLPFSVSLRRPATVGHCRQFRIHVEAPSSYVVTDQDGRIWVWINGASPSGGLISFVCLLAVAFMLAPLLALLLMRPLYRRLYLVGS
jgi:hypothetical protein